jgi:hypothetical protein
MCINSFITIAWQFRPKTVSNAGTFKKNLGLAVCQQLVKANG